VEIPCEGIVQAREHSRHCLQSGCVPATPGARSCGILKRVPILSDRTAESDKRIPTKNFSRCELKPRSHIGYGKLCAVERNFRIAAYAGGISQLKALLLTSKLGLIVIGMVRL